VPEGRTPLDGPGHDQAKDGPRRRARSTNAARHPAADHFPSLSRPDHAAGARRRRSRDPSPD